MTLTHRAPHPPPRLLRLGAGPAEHPTPAPASADARDATNRAAPSAGVTDADAIRRSQCDPEAFTAIFDRHWSRIHAFCTSRAGATGEDLAAEAFRIAFDARTRFDPAQASAAPWLYGIATNLLRQHFRSTARGSRAAARVAADPSSHDAAADPLGQLERQQLGPRLTAALGDLTELERDTFLLFAWAELSYDEIAAALAIPTGTVRSRINRARQRLRTHITTTSQEHSA